jgi:GrpB-like predicted nucleotidyltransferase (UPF0157 family)
MLGLDDDEVLLLPHQESWSTEFEKEKARLIADLEGRVVTIEHVGSTAIPGLTAKPIIDLLAGLTDLSEVDECVEPLRILGYRYLGEYGLPGRHFFRRGKPTRFHLHVVEIGSELWNRDLLFRDYLRASTDALERYRSGKKALAGRFSGDRQAYQEGKTSLIAELLVDAREWRSREGGKRD